MTTKPPSGMIARIRRTPATALKAAEIDWLVEVGWVNEWEEDFLRDTARRTAGNYARRIAPTERQLGTRLLINRTVLARYEAEKRRTPQ